jgi:hypothetical protein
MAAGGASWSVQWLMRVCDVMSCFPGGNRVMVAGGLWLGVLDRVMG